MLNLLICLLAIAMTVGSGGPRRSRLAQSILRLKLRIFL